MIARREALISSALDAERPGPFTWDDFCRLVGPKQKADLIDGVIYMASPDNTDADSLFVWLISLIDFYVEARNLGRVLGSRVALKTNSPEPDISFVRRQRLSAVKRGGVEGAADFVIEIVSPDSVERDYQKKSGSIRVPASVSTGSSTRCSKPSLHFAWTLPANTRRSNPKTASCTAAVFPVSGFGRNGSGSSHARTAPGFSRNYWRRSSARVRRSQCLQHIAAPASPAAPSSPTPVLASPG